MHHSVLFIHAILFQICPYTAPISQRNLLLVMVWMMYLIFIHAATLDADVP
jgi:hypothetical protein